MSMNLHSDEVELWQTPTWITYLAMYDSKKQRRPIEETKYIYKEWVKSTLQGSWPDADSHSQARQRVKWHLEDVDTVKDFYIM